MAGNIIGTQNPAVGTTAYYEVSIFSTLGSFSAQYEWHLFKKQKNNTWKDITGAPKTGKRVPYTFGEIAAGVEFEMKVYEIQSILPGVKSSKKLLGTLIVLPTSSKVSKIEKVVLFNRGAKDSNKAGYRDTLIAQAHCIALFNQEIEFHLWEDDAPGKGHNAAINKNNRHTRVYKGVVNEKGIAEVKISLSIDERILKQMANQYLMRGDKNEGANHEYYVTASYAGKIQKASQVNVSVSNTDYKSSPPASPPKKNLPKSPAGQGGKKQPDPNGNIVDAVFINDQGKELSKVTVGNRVRVRIHSKNLVGKHIQYIVWEYDAGSNDEIYRSESIKITADLYDSSGFIITKGIFDKGTDLPFGDPDADSQHYFIEIIMLDIGAESVKFGVDSEGLMEVENVKSPAVVKGKKEPNKQTDGKCPNCKKAFTWDEIKTIFDESDKEFRMDCINWINKYKLDFDINTCTKKAHFLAQIAAETHFRKKEMFEGKIKYIPKNIRSGIFGDRGRLLDKRGQIEEFCKQRPDQIKLFNFLYAGENGFGNGNGSEASGDGFNYRGKGLIQLTGKGNYKAAMGIIKEYVPSNIYQEIISSEKRIKKYSEFTFTEHKKQKTLKNVDLIDFITNYDMPTEPKYAVLSALADWKGKGLSNSALMLNDIGKVKQIRKIINSAGLNTDVAEDFYKKSVISLKVNECTLGKKTSKLDEKGTVVLVSGTDKKSEKDPAQNIYWIMYKTTIYRNITLSTFKKLQKENNLPSPDYTTYLSRDTHQTYSSSSKETFKHSDKRYGKYNEIPPGDYFLVPGLESQKYLVYVIDSESKSAGAENGIDGPDGSRGGVALHHYCPRFSVGCFTFNSGKNTAPVKAFVNEIPDLQLNDNKPVHFIVEPRKVKESKWDNADYGTNKWTGI